MDYGRALTLLRIEEVKDILHFNRMSLLRRKFVSRLLAVALAAMPGAFAQQPKLPPDAYPQPDRIVAVGDIHGDFDTFTQVLRDAGLINNRHRWTGGKTHLVQTGDVVDRGPDSRKVIELLMELEKQAAKAGGQVHCLLGNHEPMNMYGDLRYTSPEEFASWKYPQSAEIRENYFKEYVLSQVKNGQISESQLRSDFEESHPLGWVEQRFAFGPNGDVGKWLRTHNTIIRVGDTIFLHGGISPKYASMPRPDMNTAVVTALDKLDTIETSIVMDLQGPLWYRGLAFGPEAPLSAHVDAVLKFHGVNRIVIGHTVAMPAILPRYNGKVVVIDCGLSKVYHGTPAALIIEKGKAFALHRGKLLPLPTSNDGVAAYLQQAAALDPQPSPITQFLEGKPASTGNNDEKPAASKK